MTNITFKENGEISGLSATIQDYLSLIYVMERDTEPVVGSYLAELLGVTPPTVTNTLKRMVRDGLITMTKDGTHLTKLVGRGARRHAPSHADGMDDDQDPALVKLHSEAHMLEHAISSMTESGWSSSVTLIPARMATRCPGTSRKLLPGCR
jgi:DtxR family Mn-dependent transcriptional regulator